MQITDKLSNVKRFFKTIFRDIDFTEENIRVFQSNKEGYNKTQYFNDIDDLVNSFNNKYIWTTNTYFNLATTDENGGAKENLKYRYCLSWDFDKKDLGADFNHKDIINLFKVLKIYCHILIDSGNGYHAYVLIEKTDRLDLVEEVQKVLCDKLGADKNAIKSTQILRVPYTYNVKDKSKIVRIVHLADRHSKDFRPYNIEFLYKKNCKGLKGITDNKQTTYTLNNSNVPKCIENILKNGSTEGDRYKDLQNIVVSLRNCNRSLLEIKEVCKEWNIKSQFKDNLNYRIEHIYENKKSLEFDCKNCLEFNSCYSKIVSDFSYNDGEQLLTVSETNIAKLKYSKRKGAKVMKPNDLLVYGVLKLHTDGLTKEELLNELTYTKKKKVQNVALSDKTLRDALKSLEENGFIEVVKGNARLKIPNMYKIKEGKSKLELTYNISYSATYECVKGNISTEELRLYNFMRYLHHKKQREDPKALKGNLFQFNQIDLAEEIGVTQGRISQMIETLIDEKLLGIWYRQTSKNNGFDFNIYRLNY